jgi:hypothetical protein
MTKNVAKQDEDRVPATTEEDYADQYAGEGTKVDSEHTVTPRVIILQGLSPQVKRNNVSYVEGAKPGDIYLSAYHEPIVSGDEGIAFQPCLFQTPWEVRTPKTDTQPANFIAMFDDIQRGWVSHRSDKGFTWYETPDGNHAQQVHLHLGLLHIGGQVLPYAIKFAGTGMFISKQWNGVIGSRLTVTGKPAARFTFTYRMRVKSQTNAIGEWGQWSITPLGKATAEQMRIGHELAQAFREGRRTVEADVPGEVHDDDREAM